jgi:hypothetical protein
MPDDRHLLLHGPYCPPPLRTGDKATSLYRDCDVVVTSWTALGQFTTTLAALCR